MLSFQSGSNTVPLRITGKVAFSFKTTHAWVLWVTEVNTKTADDKSTQEKPSENKQAESETLSLRRRHLLDNHYSILPAKWLAQLQQYPAIASGSAFEQAEHWPSCSLQAPQHMDVGSFIHSNGTEFKKVEKVFDWMKLLTCTIFSVMTSTITCFSWGTSAAGSKWTSQLIVCSWSPYVWPPVNRNVLNENSIS